MTIPKEETLESGTVLREQINRISREYVSWVTIVTLTTVSLHEPLWRLSVKSRLRVLLLPADVGSVPRIYRRQASSYTHEALLAKGRGRVGCFEPKVRNRVANSQEYWLSSSVHPNIIR